MHPVTIGLVCTGAVFALLNWTALLSTLVTKRHCSMVLPLGGALLTTGLLFDAQFRNLAWVGLLVDPGMLAFVLALPGLGHQLRRSARSRLAWRMTGRSESIIVELRLYRPDYYEMTLSPATPPASPGDWRRGSLGTWQRHGERIEIISHTDRAERPARCTLAPLTSETFTVVESTGLEPRHNNPPELPAKDFCLMVHFRRQV